MCYRSMKKDMVHRFPITTHIQHWFAKKRPLSMRLSKLRIQQWAAVHKKKATLLGTLTFQIPSKGKWS